MGLQRTLLFLLALVVAANRRWDLSQSVADIDINSYTGTYGSGIDTPYGDDTSTWDGTPCVGKSADESGAYYSVSIPEAGYYVVQVRWGATPWTSASYVAWNEPPTPYINIMSAEESQEDTMQLSADTFLSAGTNFLWIGSSSILNNNNRWTIPWCAITVHGALPTTTATFTSLTGTSATTTTTETITITVSTTTDTETSTTTATHTISTETATTSLSTTSGSSTTTNTTFTTTSLEWEFTGEADVAVASMDVFLIIFVLLCCMGGLCASFWGRRYYENQKVRPNSIPAQGAKYEERLEPAPITPLKPVMIGTEMEVTLDLGTFERECLVSGLSWPSLADGRPRGLQLGERGKIEEVNFYGGIAKLSRGIDWVPIRALRGFETWHYGQERIRVQGSMGEFADFLNGTYTLSLDPWRRGRDAWRKDGAGEKWLARFDTGLWYVTSAERRLAGEAGGWMESSLPDESDPSRAGPWRVWTGSSWDLQPSVLVERFRTLAAGPTDRPVLEEGALCPNCHRLMRWTDELWSNYLTGWKCINFRTCGSYSLGPPAAPRWFCMTCQLDLCGTCCPQMQSTSPSSLWPQIANAPYSYPSNGLRAGSNSPRYYSEEAGRYDGFSQIMPSHG